MEQKRARDHGLTVGQLSTGPNNKITDVPGVTVGHCTIDTEEYKTGVTVVLPCQENPFFHKLPAASFVLNGFGKTSGLVQIDELGTLETPIALTNTMKVGLVWDALAGYMIERCAADGHTLRSVNPVVCECNDGTLNAIQARAVKQDHVRKAFDCACVDFAEGSVGAGRGMICHDLKGGIGSASRQMDLDGTTYTMGVLLLTNHGNLSDFTIAGENIGKELAEQLNKREPDKGSCIAIIATDLPLDSRQLKRVAKRASVGLARLGSFIGHGSGEVFVAFSTANAWDSRKETALRQGIFFSEDKMDLPFRAVAECTEEAVLNSMLTAETTTGRMGKTIFSLPDLWTPPHN